MEEGERSNEYCGMRNVEGGKKENESRESEGLRKKEMREEEGRSTKYEPGTRRKEVRMNKEEGRRRNEKRAAARRGIKKKDGGGNCQTRKSNRDGCT